MMLLDRGQLLLLVASAFMSGAALATMLGEVVR